MPFSINVSKYSNTHSFHIEGVSYAGNPKKNTAIYISRKVNHLINNVDECGNNLVFIDFDVQVPEYLTQNNVFVRCSNPQLEYVHFVNDYARAVAEEESRKKYTLAEGMYFFGENTFIAESAIIEPGCTIGHGVIIGKNTRVKSGAVIRNATVGDSCEICENCAIGTNGFTMTDDENGNKIRIPSLGKVIIGNNVEVGALTNISRGSAGDTVIEDYVKIDSLVHIGHDVFIRSNSEITAGSIIGGFAIIEDGVFIGINSSVRNRRTVGSGTIVGMGSNVVENVESGLTIVGNPADVIRR